MHARWPKGKRGKAAVGNRGQVLSPGAGWLLYGMMVTYIVRQRKREMAVAARARAERASLATRTVRHYVANKLAAAVGYSEMLAEDPRLPRDLEPQAQPIRANALAVVNHIDRLQDSIAAVRLDTSQAGPMLLDMRPPEDKTR